MVALGSADVLDDVGGENGKAEEGAGSDGGGHDVVGVERNSRDEAGCDAGCGVGVETSAHPDNEIANDKEGRGGSEDRSGDAKHGGLSAQHLVAEEADGRVPGPGDDVSAEMEGVAVGEDGEVIVGRHEGEGGDDGLPTATSCSEEEQASAHGGEAYAGSGEEVGKDAA